MRIKLLLSLLLLFHMSFALTLDDLRLALPVVVVIVTGVLAIAYSVSQSLNRPQLHGWVKTELRELIVAAILFAVVIGLFSGGANSLIYILTGEPDYKATARDMLAGMETRFTNGFNDVAKLFHGVGMRAAYSTSIGVPGWYFALTFGGAPSSGFGAFFTFLSPAASNLTNMLFFYTTLDVLLQFFDSVGDKLIYLAFAFRFIPFTRQLGSTLIAIVIGVYIIFPFSLVLVDGLHGVIDGPAHNNFPTPRVPQSVFTGSGVGLARIAGLEFSFPPGAYFICNKWWIRFLTANFGEIGLALPICIPIAIASLGALWAPCWYVVTQIVYPILVLVITAAWALMILPSMFTVPDMGPVFDGLKPFFADITSLVVVSVVDALIISIITIVGIKTISSALGGEYMLPGVQKMVG